MKERQCLVSSVVASVVFIAGGGCTSFEVNKASSGAKGGIPVYATNTYIFIHKTVATDKDGTVTTSYNGEVKQIVNPAKISYRIKPAPAMTGKLTLKWNDVGQLTEINGESDAKVPETLGAIASLISPISALGGKSTTKATATTTTPGIDFLVYRLADDGKTWERVGISVP